MKFTIFASIAVFAAAVAAGPSTTESDSIHDIYHKRSMTFPKAFALRMAERFNASTERINFINSIPDETFQKLRDNQVKVHQATRALWNGTIPDMAALPTPITPPPGGFRKFNGTRGGRGGRRGGRGFLGPPGTPGAPDGAKGGRRSSRDRFIGMAKFFRAPAETIEKLQNTDEAEFTGLRDLKSKDRFVKEATLLGLNDKVTFFNTVPQAIYDELDTLKAKNRAAHKDLRDGKVPTL